MGNETPRGLAGNHPLDGFNPGMDLISSNIRGKAWRRPSPILSCSIRWTHWGKMPGGQPPVGSVTS